MSERPGSQLRRRRPRPALQVVGTDADRFVDGVRALGSPTPRLDDAARLADTSQQTANTLQLVLPEGGIDVVAAAPVAREPAQQHLDAGGRRVPLGPVAEILDEKRVYGAAGLEPRGMLDPALGLGDVPEAARCAIAAPRGVHRLPRRRLANLRDPAPAARTAGMRSSEAGRAHVDGMVDRVAQAIEQCA